MTALRPRILAALALVLLAGCGAVPVHLFAPPAEKTTIRRHPVVLEVVVVPPKDKPAPPAVKRRFDAVILENQWLRATLVPELGGRVTNVVSRPTGSEVFYVGPIEYSDNEFKAGAANMGGIEVNHPYLHNGNDYCNEWLWTSETRPDGAAAVTMSFTSYPLLQRTVLTVSLAPQEALLRLNYRFENLAPFEVGFNPWINAVCRASDDAQIVLPGEWTTDHWFGANTEERFHQLYPWPADKNGMDRSRLKNNPDGLTAFAYGFTEGYAGVYYHDQDAGFVRVFDPRVMRGAKAWVGKKGWPWFELWGAVHQNMEAPGWLSPHESLTVSDAWLPVQGTGGVTWACEQGAVNFARRGQDELDVGVCVARDFGRGAVRVIADGRLLLERTCRLDPEHPFCGVAEGARDADEARLEVVDSSGRVVLARQLHLAPHPRQQFALPEKPWFRRSALAEARWHESFSPLCNWGPWWPPVQSYENVLKAEPQSREAKLGLARALLKDWASGLETLPDGGRRTAPPDPKKLARAIGLLKELAAADGSKLDALYLLGLAQMWAGDSAAAESFGKVVEREADNAPAHYCLALLAARKEEWDDVIEHARAAVNAAPDGTLARQLLAVGLLHDNEPAEAEEVLLPLLQANPAEPATVELLRRAALAQEQQDRARELAAALDHFRATAPRQTEAALKQLTDLEAGRDIDPRAVDTLSGPPLPGREP